MNFNNIGSTVLSVALVATPAVVPSPAFAASAAARDTPRSCTAATLPIPDNVAEAIVTTADPTGTVIFGRSYPDDVPFKYQVLRWENNEPNKIDFPGIDQKIDSVNTAGVGVGTSYADDFITPTAYLYRDGAVKPLPGSEGTLAHGINAANVIVGEKVGQRPLIWHSPTSDPVELPLPGGFDGGIAHAIDDDGTVVGEVFDFGGPTVGYVWAPDGTGRVLPSLGGSQDYTASTVRNGWVTGVDFNSLGDENGVRWDLRRMTVEAVPGFLSRPSAANASGWMIGTDLKGRGLLRTNDTDVTLPDVFGHEPGTFANLPETISDDGRTIAGQADDAEGTIHAAIWRC